MNIQELVDIVDENNQILYQTSKQEAHEKGLLHRTVIAEVIDSQGNWNLVKQAADRQDARQFVSPVGGHIKSGESNIIALKREAKEELGLTEFKHMYIGKAIFNREVLGRIENHYFIHFEIYSNVEPKLNHESIEFKRFIVKDLMLLIRKNPELFGEAFHFVARTFYAKLFHH